MLTGKQFTMLNNQGEILDGFYIEILEEPSANAPGKAVFVSSYPNQPVEKSEFIFTESEGILFCDTVTGPAQSFQIKISDVDGEVIAIKVCYDDNNQWEFVLLEEYLEDPSETLEETCIFNLQCAAF